MVLVIAETVRPENMDEYVERLSRRWAIGRGIDRTRAIFIMLTRPRMISATVRDIGARNRHGYTCLVFPRFGKCVPLARATHLAAPGMALLLCACAAPPWERPGTTSQQMATDLTVCEAAAPVALNRTPAGPPAKPASNLIDFDSASERSFQRARMDDEHIATCMRAKGYSRAQ